MKHHAPLNVWHLVRSGSSAPDPATVARRASAFAAASESLGTVSLLTVRDERGLDSFLLIPQGAGSTDAATHLAHAVAARVDQVEVAPDLSGRVYGTLVASGDSSGTRDSQVGADPSEVARRLVVSMRPGSWVAITLRKPTRAEIKRVRRWYAHRLGVKGTPVHHSSEDKAVIISVVAGGSDSDAVRSLLNQTAAILPGFDVDTKVRIASLPRAVAPWSVAGLALWGGAIGFGFGPVAATAAGIVPVGIGAGIASGVLPSAARTFTTQAESGVLAPPGKRHLPPRRPRRGNPDPAPGQRAVDPSPGDYPLAPNAFLVGPSVVVGLVSPHAGSSAGSAATERRSAPPALLDDIGPIIGTAGETQSQVRLSAADLWAGVALIGQPGSGKSQALRSVFGWHCLERVRPSGKPGRPGRNNTIVAFESKADGAAAYMDWVRATGDSSALIDLADPSSWAIDLFDVPGSAYERANFVANALVYAFEPNAIQDRSFETIVNLMTAAFVVDDRIATEAELPVGMSPFFYMSILLAAQGDAKAVDLAAAITSAAVKAEREAASRALPSGVAAGNELPSTSRAMTELGIAEERLATYFSGKATEASRRNYFEAPRNKIAQLLAIEHWWSPNRPKTTWRQILTEHRSVIINTGTATNGNKVEGRITRQMSSLLLYSLRDAIERYCSGWQAQGRRITVFADELALIAGSSPEVITWLRNAGRSYGVAPIFAAQYPEQLPDAIQRAFRGFGTAMWFAQSDTTVAANAAADLSMDGTEWTPGDIAQLEPFTAILRSVVNMQRQPCVPVYLTNWEADRAGYATAQGWGTPTGGHGSQS